MIKFSATVFGYLVLLGHLSNADDHSTMQPSTTTAVKMISTTTKATETKLASQYLTTTTMTMPTTRPLPVNPLPGLYTHQEKNQTCVIVKAGVRFTFSYFNYTGNETVHDAQTDLPSSNYTTEGTCGDETQRLSILFHNNKWNLTLIFGLNSTTRQFYLATLMVRYVLATGHPPFPWTSNVAYTAIYNGTGLFSTAVNRSFLCMSDIDVTSFESQHAEGYIDSIKIKGLHLQAFNQQQSSVPTDNIMQCPQDAVSLFVPIVVGIILLVLIVLVVVVYFIRRMKEEKRDDYQKVSTRT